MLWRHAVNPRNRRKERRLTPFRHAPMFAGRRDVGSSQCDTVHTIYKSQDASQNVVTALAQPTDALAHSNDRRTDTELSSGLLRAKSYNRIG